VGVQLFFLIALASAGVVFVGLLFAVYWPTRFSLRGLLVCVTVLAVVMGIAAALYRWPK
jgi:hypothetical protein